MPLPATCVHKTYVLFIVSPVSHQMYTVPYPTDQMSSELSSIIMMWWWQTEVWTLISLYFMKKIL